MPASLFRGDYMLHNEIELYSKLTGEDGWHTPIIKIGAYLDGYHKAITEIEEIYANSKYPEDLEMDIDEYLKERKNDN